MNISADTEIPTSDAKLRKAIYEAHGGKCFYTGQSVSFEKMHIDHIVPRSIGGLNCISNYVLTSEELNIAKKDHIDYSLSDRMHYINSILFVPKVIKLIQSNKGIRKKKLRIMRGQYRKWKLISAVQNIKFAIPTDQMLLGSLTLLYDSNQRDCFPFGAMATELLGQMYMSWVSSGLSLDDTTNEFNKESIYIDFAPFEDKESGQEALEFLVSLSMFDDSGIEAYRFIHNLYSAWIKRNI